MVCLHSILVLPPVAVARVTVHALKPLDPISCPERREIPESANTAKVKDKDSDATARDSIVKSTQTHAHLLITISSDPATEVTARRVPISSSVHNDSCQSRSTVQAVLLSKMRRQIVRQNHSDCDDPRSLAWLEWSTKHKRAHVSKGARNPAVNEGACVDQLGVVWTAVVEISKRKRNHQPSGEAHDAGHRLPGVRVV